MRETTVSWADNTGWSISSYSQHWLIVNAVSLIQRLWSQLETVTIYIPTDCQLSNRWYDSVFISSFAQLATHYTHLTVSECSSVLGDNYKQPLLLHVTYPNQILQEGKYKALPDHVTKVVAVCRRPIILRTVQGYFWHAQQGQMQYVWGGQAIEAGFPKRWGKDSPHHRLNAGLLVLMQYWAFLRGCSVLDRPNT